MIIKKVLPLFLIGLTLIAVLLIGSSTQSNKYDNQVENIPDDRQVPSNCFAELPGSMTFAGEKVPLEEDEIKERLDRELNINTYWHSSTIQIIKLANRWFPVIEPILEKHNIPGDFKYMPIAESSFRNATSKVGATGYWQFMKATGLEYGLKITSEVDERYHVEKATEAACKYLLEGYEKFGTWTATAAGYNAGMPRIESSLDNQGVSSYYDLYLNKETARYVFRLLAFKLILEDPVKYGFCFDDGDLYQPLKVKNVEITTSITNMSAYALGNNTNLKTIKYLNPWLKGNKLTVRENEKYTLKLPA